MQFRTEFMLYGAKPFTSAQFLQFEYMSFFKNLIFEVTGTYDEQALIDFLVANYGSSIEDARTTVAELKVNYSQTVCFSNPDVVVNVMLPKGGDFYYFMMPKYDFASGAKQTLTFNGTESMNIHVENNFISANIIPEGISDGTYLKILGDCSLLNSNLLTNDYFILHSGKTDGIRIR